jgi:hypothetical protein
MKKSKVMKKVAAVAMKAQELAQKVGFFLIFMI